jgi:hypothetical protein
MTGSWPAPVPQALASVSPSRVNSLLRCGLRVAFEQDHRFRHWRRPTPRSSLGIAAHKLTEESFSHQFDNEDTEQRAAWLTRRWNALIHAQAELMRSAWGPALPPEAKDWPGYAFVKVRLVRRLAREQIDAGSHYPAQASFRHADPATPRLPLLECRMEDPVAGIHGTPDRVEKSDGRLRVLDLKSGLHQGDVTDDQRRQMLLYGHLVTATLGESPNDLIIVDIAGRETAVPFDLSDEAGAVLLVQRTRESWNSAIEAGDTAFSLASPSPEACRWCPFRVACLPSWQAWEPSWEIPAAVSGIVREVTQASQSFEVHLAQDLPSAAAGEEARLVGIPEQGIAVGDHLVVTDVDQIGQGAYRLRWWSRVRLTKTS